MHRRSFLKTVGTSAAAIAALAPCSSSTKEPERFNVLFVAIDDLNDWVGCIGGNPQAITPNFDRFVKQHGMVMSKAYCPSTVCGPTRSAILTGKRAASTGVYGNKQNIKNAPKAKDLVTISEYFGEHGYYTLSAGKIFHKHPTQQGIDEGQWAFHQHAAPKGSNFGLIKKTSPPHVDGKKYSGSDFAWGPLKAKLEETKDYATCKWGADKLKGDFTGKPFFMAIGISKPHLPWYVPQKYFDMYKLEDIKVPDHHMDDLKDITRPNGKPMFTPDERFLATEKADMHKEAVRAYLAAVSYADDCLGVLLNALEKSRYHENTIVMIWGDHGWYLTEKLRYGKCRLWEEAARVPFIVRVPGLTPAGFKCDGVVNLLDMYPTLVELCGLPANPENEGRSFADLMRDPKIQWEHPTLTTYGFKNHSIFDGRYRYIWHGSRDGVEELYDHESDPKEWKNIASNPEYKEIIARLKQYLPEHNEPPSPENTIDEKTKKEMIRNRGKNKK